ncbi:bifunctional 2-polyprenyl-6-hydroxyphenol methylase/3-demethylubiquinol 3-O-methyltransferase UbiG [Ferrimonas sp. SCSIO 43195]|uniref:bifunctional 2-polyprenyl-6-hydroxyphenol methylase/3-demethylubiquinol 3-O-methyltransferase UbiG n=1 Tax=Ferrimonas sp. SCSIO 43195 TaxID=2822844 RepID=UPI0020751A81|nr:bifunctional 2-polyprenyl-6-hydroxyphenol methylase/3-demethylubiquinol 3-O-methyltransferase UbiG [Ferrimonas sp. SCSIO 43195]USD39501.1 bifunctional 2-polyprenyl-6-hydroxyphenol methylase/3-demethylubiquinol 3-O-methyltransferase UbiG [Ferrimonas sp. SCSIO 43195]
MLHRDKLSPELAANLSEREIEKFDALAEAWWDPDGPFKTVLAFNAVRLQYITDAIDAHLADAAGLGQTSENQPLTVLDVGCGAGLLAEPLARQGHRVTAIDASAHNIEVARRHARLSATQVDYRHCLTTALLQERQQYDVVLNTEVVEHVPDPQALLTECGQLLKPGGLLIVATLNRTIKSFFVAIIGAEYVLRALPRGTHDWRAFVSPTEIIQAIAPQGFEINDLTGMSYNPFSRRWRPSHSADVNYLLSARKL